MIISMRIVHIADLHLGKTLFDIPLIEDQRLWLYALAEFLATQQANALVIAGDVYQRSVPSTEAVTLLDDFLNTVIRRLHIPVLMIAGNHDSGERLGFASRLFEESGLHVSGSVQKQLKTVTLKDAYGAVNFVLLPYFEPYPIKKLYDDDSIKTMNDAFTRICGESIEPILSESSPDTRNVLVAHGFFGVDSSLACFSDSERSVGGSDMIDYTLLKRFDYVALGHLHAPQTAGAPHIRYAGSPLKYSLSEAAQQKSVTVVELLEKGNVTVTSHTLPAAHDLRILTGTIDSLTAEAAKGATANDYVYAVLTDKGEVYNAMEKLRAVYPNILGLRRALSDVEVSVMSAGLELNKKTPDELFGAFYQELLGERITPQREALMHELLLEAQREESLP